MQITPAQWVHSQSNMLWAELRSVGSTYGVQAMLEFKCLRDGTGQQDFEEVVEALP